MADEGIIVRRADETDQGPLLDLCRRSLGWGADTRNEAFFQWKHRENPAGNSPAWVALTPNGELVGARLFLCWEFTDPRDGVCRAFRAVDTAVDPEWRGRGVFTRLTSGALPELEAQGGGFVFNTPNAQSRPGYLKMGWHEVGRVPLLIRPALRPGAVVRLLRGRGTAAMWGLHTTVGRSAAEVLGERSDLEALSETATATAAGRATDHVHTRRSASYLRWRYSFAPLNYRCTEVDDGLVIWRLRRRGPLAECTVCETLGLSPRQAAGGVAGILRATGADVAISLPLPGAAVRTRGIVPGYGVGSGGAVLPLGPVLTWRPLCRPGIPNLADLGLSLGDLELF